MAFITDALNIFETSLRHGKFDESHICHEFQGASYESCFATRTQEPLMARGDFNVILSRNERLLGAEPHASSMEDFALTLLDCGLLDAGFEGNRFTWTNSHMFQRLDRVFYNMQWSAHFASTRVQHLNRDESDHCPLLITSTESLVERPSSFRFLHAWLKHHDFLNFVGRNWHEPMHSTGLMSFWLKQQRLKKALKVWSKNVFGDIFRNIQVAEQHALELISDNILLAQELVGKIDYNARGGNVILKLDMMKAYDRLNWDFLYLILERFDFNSQWIDMIKSSKKQIITQATGFHHKTLLVTYLGAPLYKRPKKVMLFDSLITKIWERITRWENKILSIGGRITLVQSVLSSLPIYLLQVLKPQVSVIEKIDILFNSFLWGDTLDSKHIHWSSWNKVTFPSSKGGLDIRSLQDVFEAFSAKLWWCFQTCSSLWTRYMKAKYDTDKIPQ
ncbi:Uncharacterized protein TCM_024576 [Theobroma cacao]|uniref:Reverse transcriptase domain-containing protein n=1 Tax=Theobroma cacao TaxID=3641 RepID=A0A061F3W3_THECC|nr:Uncharacterized protein TCM_024576 [Theobroma cacao]